jgi:NAD(P)-dependent dehydrogenase (short-subunit alcohol dehydrogenase family)
MQSFDRSDGTPVLHTFDQQELGRARRRRGAMVGGGQGDEMELGLEDQVIVVTGASRGIGLAVVRAFVFEGARVIAAARRSSHELDELAKGPVDVVLIDLADPSGPARLVESAGTRIDVLVNNVGSAPVRTGGFLDVTDHQWATSINLNLMAAVRTTRSALAVMLPARRGAIVNVCSVNAELPDPLVIDYGAAKAALLNFSKALSKEVGPEGIRVNTVSPGPVSTDLWMGETGVAAAVARARGIVPQAVVDDAVQAIVTGRFSQPSEIADAVLMLASERAGNVTGTDVRIDGGLVPTW